MVAGIISSPCNASTKKINPDLKCYWCADKDVPEFQTKTSNEGRSTRKYQDFSLQNSIWDKFWSRGLHLIYLCDSLTSLTDFLPRLRRPHLHELAARLALFDDFDRLLSNYSLYRVNWLCRIHTLQYAGAIVKVSGGTVAREHCDTWHKQQKVTSNIGSKLWH